MRISEKLINLRKDNNLTQEEFAEILHVSRQTVSNWETKKFYPDIETLVLISNTFNISLDVLLKDDQEMIKKLDKRISKSAKRIIIVLIAIIILFIGSMIGLLKLEDYNDKRYAIELKELKNDINNTKKIVIGNKFLQDNSNKIDFNNTSFGVVGEITDTSEIQEFTNILENISFHKKEYMKNNAPYFVIKLLDKNNKIIKYFTFSYVESELINIEEKIYLNRDDVKKLNELLKDYEVPFKKYNPNLANKLLNTKSIVVRKYLSNDYIKTIKDGEVIREIIEIIINAEIGEGDITTVADTYTLEFLDNQDKIIAKSNFNPHLSLEEHYLFNYDLEKLNDLVENN